MRIHLFDKLSPEDQEIFLSLTKIVVLDKEITYQMYSVSKVEVTEKNRSFVPCVIEPSFGIGRIMTGLLEHSFFLRENKENGIRRVLSFKPWIAPIKCVILAEPMKLIPDQLVNEVQSLFKKYNIVAQVDDSQASIGKRYSRYDEIGTPYAVTLDKRTLEDKTVTIRERNSMKQVRCSIDEAVESINQLILDVLTWENIETKFDQFVTVKSE